MNFRTRVKNATGNLDVLIEEMIEVIDRQEKDLNVFRNMETFVRLDRSNSSISNDDYGNLEILVNVRIDDSLYTLLRNCITINKSIFVDYTDDRIKCSGNMIVTDCSICNSVFGTTATFELTGVN